MSTLGNTGTPSSGWLWPGSGYAAATSFTTPSGGGILISTLHGYLDSASGSSTGYLCVWDNSGNLLASVNVGTLAVGSQSAGGQQWYSGNLSSPVYVAGSTAIWIGFYATGSLLFSSESGGSSNTKSMGSGGPGSFSGSSSSGIGGVGAYVVYTNAGAWVNTGTPSSPVWTAGPIQINTGTPGSPVWTAIETDVNTGTPGAPTWTPGS
jgi:hypothetical protein